MTIIYSNTFPKNHFKKFLNSLIILSYSILSHAICIVISLDSLWSMEVKVFSYIAIFHMTRCLTRTTCGVVSSWDPLSWPQLSEELWVCPGSLLILCLAPLPQWLPKGHLPEKKKWSWAIPFKSAVKNTRTPASVIPKASMSHSICTSFATSLHVLCYFPVACPNFPEYIQQWLKNITDRAWIMSFWNLYVAGWFLRTSEWGYIWR